MTDKSLPLCGLKFLEDFPFFERFMKILIEYLRDIKKQN